MSSSSVHKEEVITEKIQTNKLYIKETVADSITSDYRIKDMRTLITAKALNDVHRLVSNRLDTFETDSSLFKDNSVITMNLMSSVMSSIDTDPEKGYIVEGLDRVDVSWVYTQTSNLHDNKLEVPNNILTVVGKYIFIIDVTIESGIVVVRNNDGHIFGTISSSGTHVIEVDVENLALDTLELTCSSAIEGQSITFNSVSFHRVTNRLYLYILYKFNDLLLEFSESGYVTETQLEQAIGVLETSLTELISNRIDQVNSSITHHLESDNPHEITPDLINAAWKVHAHTPDECDAAPIDHTHTPNSIGAAPANHTHTPNSIGAAKADHDHDDKYMLKAEMITSKPMKSSVILDSELGFLPEKLNHTKANLPTIVLLTGNLTHETDSLYDPSSGMITSNKKTIASSKLQNAVIKDKIATIEQDSEKEYTPTVINYQLQVERPIKRLIFKKLSTSVSYPTQIRVKNNGDVSSDIYHLVWTGNEAVVNLSPVMENVKRFSITVEEIFDNANWDINFDIIFDDVALNSFFIYPGLSCTFETASLVELNSPTEDPIYFNISNMVKDHPYYVALTMDDDKQLHAHTVGIAPQYGVKDRGVDPFLGYEDGPIDPFYGHITATSEHPSYSVENIYRKIDDSFRTDAGQNEVTIEHDFGRARKVADIALVFKKDEIDSIPRDIVVKGKLESGNIITIKTIDNYIPDINNDSEDSVSIYLDVAQSLSKLILELSNPTGDDIRVNTFKVSLSSEFYNVNRLKWADDKMRNYIGVIYKRDNNRYDIRSYPVGDTTCLMVNGLSPGVPGKIYSIVNPFGTRNIDTELICLDRTNNIIPPMASIVGISYDEILVKTETEDLFAVSCFREW